MDLITFTFRGESWSEEAKDYFEEISKCAKWEELQAEIVSYSKSTSPGAQIPVINLKDCSGLEVRNPSLTFHSASSNIKFLGR